MYKKENQSNTNNNQSDQFSSFSLTYDFPKEYKIVNEINFELKDTSCYNGVVRTEMAILYFLSGDGVLFCDNRTEVISKFDRFVIFRDTEYKICNTGSKLLGFLITDFNYESTKDEKLE
jgi:hypothetical protein